MLAMLTSGPNRVVTPMNSLHLCLPAQDLKKMVLAKFPSQMKEGQIRLLTSQCNSWKFLVSGEGVYMYKQTTFHLCLHATLTQRVTGTKKATTKTWKYKRIRRKEVFQSRWERDEKEQCRRRIAKMYPRLYMYLWNSQGITYLSVQNKKIPNKGEKVRIFRLKQWVPQKGH